MLTFQKRRRRSFRPIILIVLLLIIAIACTVIIPKLMSEKTKCFFMSKKNPDGIELTDAQYKEAMEQIETKIKWEDKTTKPYLQDERFCEADMYCVNQKGDTVNMYMNLAAGTYVKYRDKVYKVWGKRDIAHATAKWVGDKLTVEDVWMLPEGVDRVSTINKKFPPAARYGAIYGGNEVVDDKLAQTAGAFFKAAVSENRFDMDNNGVVTITAIKKGWIGEYSFDTTVVSQEYMQQK